VIALVAVAAFVLSGHVLDRTTGQPLSGVAVRAGSAKAKTDGSGHYTLRGLHVGKVTIVLESDDVPPQSFEITLHQAKTQRDFEACSTTLDYSCAPQVPLPNPGT
jgi:5-hydroxyisourate hydrolase-like protein (transthyretin family)